MSERIEERLRALEEEVKAESVRARDEEEALRKDIREQISETMAEVEVHAIERIAALERSLRKDV